MHRLHSCAFSSLRWLRYRVGTTCDHEDYGMHVAHTEMDIHDPGKEEGEDEFHTDLHQSSCMHCEAEGKAHHDVEGTKDERWNAAHGEDMLTYRRYEHADRSKA